MPASGSRMFTGPDGYQGNLDDLLDLLVPEPATFRAHLTWLELSLIHLVRLEEAAARVAYLRLPPGRVFVTFPMHPTTELLIPGAVLRFGDLMVHRRGDRMHQRTQGPARWGILSLTPAALVRFGETITGRHFAVPARSQIVAARLADCRRLLRFCRQACRIFETNLGSLDNQELVRSIEQDLIWSLVTCLAKGRVREQDRSEARLGEIAAELEALLAASPGRRRPAREIMLQLGISAHTLRMVARSALGMSVAHHQRLRRLKLARAELIRSDRRCADNISIIRAFGYTNLSQFVAEYWDVYGEMPPIPPRSSHRIFPA